MNWKNFFMKGLLALIFDFKLNNIKRFIEVWNFKGKFRYTLEKDLNLNIVMGKCFGRLNNWERRILTLCTIRNEEAEALMESVCGKFPDKPSGWGYDFYRSLFCNMASPEQKKRMSMLAKDAEFFNKTLRRTIESRIPTTRGVKLYMRSSWRIVEGKELKILAHVSNGFIAVVHRS